MKRGTEKKYNLIIKLPFQEVGGNFDREQAMRSQKNKSCCVGEEFLLSFSSRTTKGLAHDHGIFTTFTP